MTQRIVSLGFLAAAVVVLAQAFAIPQGEGYQAVGPRAFPLLVGVGLAVVSIVGVVQAFRPGTREPDATPPAPAAAGTVDVGGGVGVGLSADGGGEASEKPHWPSVLLLIGSLAAYALLLVPAGYWQATTAFFVAVARVLGSRRLVRDVLVGLALALATYFLFDRLLGISLPPGLVRLAI
ncbi:tripartite tricarboxylate transporter TctB family protein [Nonomuraea angiospora]|uniref:tripartite tricarboxylate transporter TctB family protein n=1 Tax=Nonomuraea angiospora TaxID=46172 RepID=UPI0029B33EF8|nr:tripartite tricarboxylate transporter TctB family protein [Nonomuraea angiospora]MDX3109724.1 tripartite tricarboxylate transporter TctB family protein [Nonomuraea angiospora]